MDIYTLPLIGLVEEGPKIRTFLFNKPEGLTWRPGSHVHVALPGFNADGERHPALVRHMSICTLPEEGRLGFTTRLDSSLSTFKVALGKLYLGNELSFFKFGSALDLARDGRPVVLVTQGVGIAAVRPVILDYARNQTGVPSLTSITVSGGAHGIYQDEFDSMEDVPGLSLRRVSHRAELADAIEAVPDPDGATFEVVGSDAFITGIIAQLRARGVADEHIVLDKNPAKRAPFFAA